ncbi:LysE family transporter [Psychrobacter sp. P2G3]|uniref:LysE family transporter n=1 Tax=Psychrobacter sp. P2G3 TaxID=1699622 RepID=UPI0022430D5F|nr:LysE family transporter [Psychrobacter sp. P2G3]
MASLGLPVLLAKSPTAFMLVKYICASHLCYLSFKMITSKKESLIANSLQEDRNCANLSFKSLKAC